MSVSFGILVGFIAWFVVRYLLAGLYTVDQNERAGGMSAAIAVVEALKKTQGNTATEKLIAAMEGMSFETPKGTMTFRKEDHQAMQNMYQFRIKNDPAFAWGVPELVRVIPAAELQIPIRNKR